MKLNLKIILINIHTSIISILECEHKGRTYANGERLETVPGGECKVCYCRGGEVQCADVSCYIRTDCEGRTVAGQCCPKYDHCPPKGTYVYLSPHFLFIIYLCTTIGIKESKFTHVTFSFKAPSLDANQSLSTNSKITESNTPTTVTESINSNVTNENEIETTRSYEQDQQGSNNKIDITNGLNVDSPTTEYSPLETKETNYTKENNEDDNNNNEKDIPEITIREIIPEIKEIPITGPPKHEIFITHIDDNVHNNDLLDTDTESSEILENYQPPPVLRIGDKLLFLKKGEFVPEKDVSTPSPVITIIGAEGLQRGFEESLETHEINLNENLDKNNSATEEEDVIGSESAVIEERIHPAKESNPKREINSSNNLPKQLLSSTDNDKSSVNKESIIPLHNNEESVKATLPDENLTSIDIDNTTIDIAVEIPTISTILLEETTEYSTKYSTTESTIPITNKPLQPPREVPSKEPDEYVENPAYPPIPDVMNLSNVELNTDPPTSIPKILPDVLPIRSNKTIGNTSHSEWLKEQAGHTLVNKDATLDEETLSQVAPSDLELTTELATETTPIDVNNSTHNVEKDIEQLIAKYSVLTHAVDKLKVSTIPDEIITETILSASVVPTILGISSDIRSTETLETVSAENRELTTPAGSKAIFAENASVEPENISLSSKETDSTEGISIITKEIERTTTTTSSVSTSKPDTSEIVNLKEEVEMLPDDTPGITKNSKALPKDLEIKNVESSQLDTNKIQKNGKKDNDGDDIFKELNKELEILDNPEKFTKSPEEEKEEAELIFKELLDEIHGTKTGSKDREVDKVSKVIAKYNVKNTKQSLDTSLLGILREFINSQRLYNQHP